MSSAHKPLAKWHSHLKRLFAITLEKLFAPFYKKLFATSFFQDNSSDSFPIMPDEFGEHRTRDQKPFLHTISPDPSDFQIHVERLSNSAHTFSIGFRSGTRMDIADAWICVHVTHFCFDFWFWIIVLLEDPNMVHYKISSKVCHVLIFHDTIFEQDVQDLWQKK